ncbi:GYD domain-containing protein [Ramlibacter sp.]|uniref:GYD domain-containing protein n=1 Tax=Ramlibacter sp. TaxID=1917967 RepID=UPI002D6A2B33|nr:GYD domain-containing protein [Ramlibacter sp.]HYD76361.1 GYD domain-containing protein [Ramlibacter sp.]
MATYFALVTFTDQGLRSVKDTVKRADAAQELASRFGVRMTEIHWTLGPCDVLVKCEAQDEASVTAFNLALCSAGNVRTQTLRAFSRDEMAKVIEKLP